MKFKQKNTYLLSVMLLVLTFVLALVGCANNSVPKPISESTSNLMPVKSAEQDKTAKENAAGTEIRKVAENSVYSKPDEVAEYFRTYHKLPPNYITKKQAADQGWISEKGNLWLVTQKKSIGGDRFGNLEGKLPKATGRQWYECDVNYYGGFRGSERLLYSNDGLIYYTKDHYNNFQKLY